MKANAKFRFLSNQASFDVVWRMHPYGIYSPIPPTTTGLPLVVGPLFYGWPKNELSPGERRMFRPGRLLDPFADGFGIEP